MSRAVRVSLRRAAGATAAWCAVMHVLAATSAAAQETRAAAIAQAQAAKAEAMQPYTPGTAERIAGRLKERFLRPNRFYVVFDSVYSGGGLTGGGGYRHFYGDQTFWNLRGLLSVKGYKLVEFTTDSVGLSNGRIDTRAVAGWRDATQVSFYGLGGDTPVEAKSNFRMQQAYVGAGVHAKGPGPMVVDFGVRYEDFTLESGTGTSPSIEQMYTTDTAPGLGVNPDYLHTNVTGGVDSRPSPGYARRGGLYALSYDAYIDREGVYTFDRLQAEVVQHVPVLRENWVVSLHGVARTTIDDDAVVPFYLLPSLGSGSTLRAYPSWRFRDRHSLLVSGEWRWIPNRMFLDMAVFYDAGKVTSRREDLNFSGLKQDVGVGFRLHGPAATPLRIDVAHGSEGLNIVFSGAAPF
jgi:hypothetical protein